MHLDGSPQLGNREVLFATPKTGDWSGLDPLAALTELEVRGYHPGLKKYLATRPLIRELHLFDAQAKRIDLRETYVDDLFLEAPAATSVYLPASCTEVSLNRCLPKTVKPASKLDEFGVRFYQLGKTDCVIPAGLRHLTELKVIGSARFDPAWLRACNKLNDLRLQDIGEVVELGALLDERYSSLELIDCYNIDLGDALERARPDHLRIVISGVRKSTADALKKAWKGPPVAGHPRR